MESFSEIDFGSFLVYPTKGETEASKRIRVVCLTVKNDGHLITQDKKRHRAIPTIVDRLSKEITDGPLKGFFDNSPILVPMPRSTPVPKGGLIPAKTISEEMVKAGLGSSVASLLERIKVVPKAAQAKTYDQRPTIQQHVDSMRIEVDLLSPITSRPIVVIDDFITRGTSFIAAVSMLRKALPRSAVRAFAVVRVLSGAGIEASKAIEPCRGTIRRSGDWGSRTDTSVLI